MRGGMTDLKMKYFMMTLQNRDESGARFKIWAWKNHKRGFTKGWLKIGKPDRLIMF